MKRHAKWPREYDSGSNMVGHGRYNNVLLVIHRGLTAYLVKGPRLETCCWRTYRFAEVVDATARKGLHVDSALEVDFGPTMLVPVEGIENAST